MDDQIAPWFIANRLDFLVLSDGGFAGQRTQHVWARATGGGRVPGVVVVGSNRVGIAFDAARWEARWRRDKSSFSQSGRSMSATFRLGSNGHVTVIATYCPHNPSENLTDTTREREWLTRRIAAARRDRHVCVVAGDFNATPNETYDRQGPMARNSRAAQQSTLFERWAVEAGVTSTFRHRHPTTHRHTYVNNGHHAALDDIYVTEEHSRMIRESGIWLRSLNQGDHVGTPFAALRLDTDSHTRTGLRHVKAIKTVNTRTKTPDEMARLGEKITEQLANGTTALTRPLEGGNHTKDEIAAWLDQAIPNVHECIYRAAKELWGETSQTRRDIDRAISVKRSNRCNGQLKALRNALGGDDVTASQLLTGMRKVQWPKWVVYPARLPPTCAHAQGAQELSRWRVEVVEETVEAAREWMERGWKLWRAVWRTRRAWRQTQRRQQQHARRERWMDTGETRKFLRDVLGNQLPPVHIRGGLTGQGPEYEYHETRTATQETLTTLLDQWVPHDERTTEPRHFSTGAVEDEEALPRFVREWLLPDIKAGGTRREAFNEAGHCWKDHHYDAAMHQRLDSQLSKRVAPGYGGVSQEMWIAAPAPIRERERQIINWILKTGVAPPALHHRQMIFLPKTATATGIWDRRGLPPWRPITVQSALATRLFTVASNYLESRAPNHAVQHGFQRDRNVEDAALATTLLMDRARERNERLYMLSKDCEKCYDRIPRWVMGYIYQRLGVPTVLYRLLMSFLSAGEIDIRTAYGWIASGKREFGLGQGSVLSIRHIGYYMDVLIEQQVKGPGAVRVRHGQPNGHYDITTTVLVDDIIDVAATRAGIEHRAATSNVFTGITGTGGVFGASKSFLLCHAPRGATTEPHVHLHDGQSQPRPVRTVSAAEGFKHLGIVQSTDDVWSKTVSPVWAQLRRDAKRLCAKQVSARQLRLVVNHVWIPRVLYRAQLSSAIKMATHVDKLVRHVARRVLKLPYGLPTAVFHDATQGIGLRSAVAECHAARVQSALRTLNTPHIPAHHLLVEALERYQCAAGLTEHPLANPVPPPSHLTGWLHQTIRSAAAIGARTAGEWTSPPTCVSSRPGDRPIWTHMSAEHRAVLVRYNIKFEPKIRYVGDVADAMGTRLLSATELATIHGWAPHRMAAYARVEAIVQTAAGAGPDRVLRQPVGCTRYDTRHLQMAPVHVRPGHFFIVTQYELVQGEPRMRGYELGNREGDTVNETAEGREINVQWWHERRAGSGIWTRRPWDPDDPDAGEPLEFAALCVPVTVTELPQSGRRRGPRRLIIWEDTEVAGVRGSTPRSAIDEAFQLLVAWHRGEGEAASVTACTECHRLAGVTRCVACGDWHHAHCRDCTTERSDDQPDIENEECRAWATYAQTDDGEDVTRYRAGDGSVLNAGTTAASGGWGLCAPRASQIGRLAVHWADITSTRCECHALIAGLAATEDFGEQVCDNTAAISVLNHARAIADGTRSHHVAYSHRHRVEIASMVALMRQGGSFRAVWVRSHQEGQPTSDLVLASQRRALAKADELAARSHIATTEDTYAHLIKWDRLHVLDAHGRPVVGNTRAFLRQSAQRRAKQGWLERQQQRGPDRQTATTAAINTVELTRWTDHQAAFYWRTIGSALHTNAQKHRLHAAWPQRCRVCPHDKDTQGHRYGAAAPECTSAASYRELARTAVSDVCGEHWLPDQEIFLPGYSHAIAARTTRQTRPHWTRGGTAPGRWQVMVQLEAHEWIHAAHERTLLKTASIPEYAASLHRVERRHTQRAPTGRLLPRGILQAVRSCSPAASVHQYHPSQASGLWTWGSLDDRYERRTGELAIPPEPLDHTSRWVDDTFVPRTAGQWAELRTWFHTGHDTRRVLWAACYVGTPGHKVMEENGAVWYVIIPAGSLRMRTAQSVYQVQEVAKHQLVSNNTREIRVGALAHVWEADASARCRAVWADAMRRPFSREWLTNACDDPVQGGADARQAQLLWAPLADVEHVSADLAPVRRWLHEELTDIFEAPIGWRVWPSATPSTAQLARVCSYTQAGATRWHAAIMRALWTAIGDHWRATCQATVEAITADGDQEIWERVNDAIRTGRRRHDHGPTGMDSALAAHAARLDTRRQRWERERAGHDTQQPTG